MRIGECQPSWLLFDAQVCIFRPRFAVFIFNWYGSYTYLTCIAVVVDLSRGLYDVAFKCTLAEMRKADGAKRTGTVNVPVMWDSAVKSCATTFSYLSMLIGDKLETVDCLALGLDQMLVSCNFSSCLKLLLLDQKFCAMQLMQLFPIHLTCSLNCKQTVMYKAVNNLTSGCFSYHKKTR